MKLEQKEERKKERKKEKPQYVRSLSTRWCRPDVVTAWAHGGRLSPQKKKKRSHSHFGSSLLPHAPLGGAPKHRPLWGEEISLLAPEEWTRVTMEEA